MHIFNTLCHYSIILLDACLWITMRRPKYVGDIVKMNLFHCAVVGLIAVYLHLCLHLYSYLYSLLLTAVEHIP